jgi:hypothetical protein
MAWAQPDLVLPGDPTGTPHSLDYFASFSAKCRIVTPTPRQTGSLLHPNLAKNTPNNILVAMWTTLAWSRFTGWLGAFTLPIFPAIRSE